MSERAQRQGTTPEAIEEASARNSAIRRIIDPKELGYLVAFLSSPKAECITGEVIAAGGSAPGAVFQ